MEHLHARNTRLSASYAGYRHMWRSIGALESPILGRLTRFSTTPNAQPPFACDTIWPGGL
jgi:hypothetical protein